MDTIKIGVLTGSVRRGSFCRQIAQNVSAMMPPELVVKPVEIGNLALFNQDYDDDGKTPPEWKTFRQEIKSLDGYIFVTPEYNRSIPPVLKNALDIASRPYGQNCWGAKPGAVISVSIGKLGAFGANHHLRQTMSFLDIWLMQQPEAYISNVASLLDEQGKLIDTSTKEFLQRFANSFAHWVEKMR
jgi:chromate reductase